MNNTSKSSEIALIIAFLFIVAAVPVAQIGIELHRGDPVQLLDLFEYRLDDTRTFEKHLRDFETTLEDTSWFQQNIRPCTQKLLFRTLRETGAKGVMGRQDWIFYRPAVQYLIEPDRADPDTKSKWVEPGGRDTKREHVLKVITQYRDMLEAKNIQLLVVPVPNKATIYPDKLTARMDGRAYDFRSPTEDLLVDLEKRGVATVDLFSLFREARREYRELGNGTWPDAPLYLERDTHWTPRGAERAAQAVAEKVKAMGVTLEPQRKFTVRDVTVERHGDILEMMQIPGIQNMYLPQVIRCRQVSDNVSGLLMPLREDRPGTVQKIASDSTVLVLGDSFCRIYQIPEPAAFGQVLDPVKGTTPEPKRTSKRGLPGSAGFLSHLSLALGIPALYIVSDGGASTDVRKMLAVFPEMLDNKGIVIWEFVERDIYLGREGWEPNIPLPKLFNE